MGGLEELRFFQIQGNIPFENIITDFYVSSRDSAFFGFISKFVEKFNMIYGWDGEFLFFANTKNFGVCGWSNRYRQYSFITRGTVSYGDMYSWFSIFAPANKVYSYFRVIERILKSNTYARVKIGGVNDKYFLEITIYKDLLQTPYVITALSLVPLGEEIPYPTPADISYYFHNVEAWITKSGFAVSDYMNNPRYRILKNAKPELETVISWGYPQRITISVGGETVSIDPKVIRFINGDDTIRLDYAPVMFPSSRYGILNLYGFSSDNKGQSGLIAIMDYNTLDLYAEWVSIFWGEKVG